MADDDHGGPPALSTAPAPGDAAQKDAPPPPLSAAHSDGSAPDPPRSPRAFVAYTRPQILALYHSPLVKPLDHMPPIREWFGEWPEQNNKGYGDTLTLNSVPRDRRFRRDQDDSEPATRATFRSGALSQPSQMGNFKHQSTRTTDRDRERDRERDRDADKERERDLRDREGQERLRSLSDKYDRDRLGSSATNGTRGKDRDSAPHLSAGSGRLSATAAGATPRRGEGRERGEGRGEGRGEREGGTRKKAGESADDWRRGRDDRPEPTRRDSSRHRDSSRTRRDPSASRRDRNREHERDGDRRRGGDDDDDARRWREDGKGGERLQSRRERDREARDRGDRKERGERRERNGDSAWETDKRDRGGRDRDRNDRWTTEEREDKGRRANGREKRGDDEKEERGERGKEKEPAWMETYVPPPSSGSGILGGKGAEDGLDGIQAWKKGMKEKEEKEKAGEAGEAKPKPSAGGLDEIAMFKQMMKLEEAKKKDTGAPSGAEPSAPAASDLAPPPGLAGPKASTSISLATLMNSASSGSSPAAPAAAALQPTAATSEPHAPASQEPSRPAGSRFFPAPPTSAQPPAEQHFPASSEPSIDSNIASPLQPYNPPSGPRLLSLGTRASSSSLGPKTPSGLEPTSSTFGPTLSQLSDAQPPPAAFAPEMQQRLGSMDPVFPAQRAAPAPGVRTQMSYPSYENQLRPPISLEESGYPIEAARHHAALERNQFGTPPMQTPYSEMGGPQQGFPLRGQSPAFDIPERSQGGSPYQSKGSRFAKFFDGGKARDMPPQQQHMGKMQGGPEYGGQQLPNAMQRLDIGGGGDMYGGGGAAEGRTMEDLFQMLQNSTQRGGPGSMNVPSLHHGGNLPYNQQQLPMHMHQAERNPPPPPRNIDMLYDNRLDDRNFMPDGMVPGLRSVPPPRGRDSAPIFRDQDDMAFNVQPRLPQQRGLDPGYGAPPQGYPNPARGLAGPPYRNGVSPVNHNALFAQQQQQQQQRMPPGLANLGGRPPHEAQFINPGMQALGGDPRQAQFGGGGAGGMPMGAGGALGGYPNAPHMRGPPPPQQLGLGPNALGAGLPGKLDHLRGLNQAQQAQLLGLGGMGGAPDVRRPSVGMLPGQMGGGALHTQQLLAARQQAEQQQRQQQQQQGLPQHMLPRGLPPHMQGGIGGGGGPIGQPAAQDLMLALLMHGAPRE